MAYGSKNFMPLGPVSDWIPRDKKSATACQMINAYKQLLQMIKSGLVKASGKCNDAQVAARIAHLQERHRQASALARNYKSLRYARASGEIRKEPSSVNFAGWKKVIKTYRKSATRQAAFELFGSKYPWYS